MNKRVTIKTIATKVGVHYSTVSLALNNHPSIPAATRERIEKAAKSLGYRRDPVLSALVAYRSNTRPPAEYGVIAWVDLWTTKESVGDRYGELWKGASQRANAFGWKLEPFRLAFAGISTAQLSKILHSRGIEGILIPPVPETDMSLELEWSRFSAVTIGQSLHNPGLHRVIPHQLSNMRTIWAKLAELGYRRVGLHLTPEDNDRSRHDWLAAFLECEFSSGKKRPAAPWIRYLQTGKEFVQWVRRHRFDAIISTHPDQAIAALEKEGIAVPRDVGVASPRNESRLVKRKITAVDECFETVGMRAVDSLVGMMHRNEKGFPEMPLQVMVAGKLVEGDTVLAQRHDTA